MADYDGAAAVGITAGVMEAMLYKIDNNPGDKTAKKPILTTLRHLLKP